MTIFSFGMMPSCSSNSEAIPALPKEPTDNSEEGKVNQRTDAESLVAVFFDKTEGEEAGKWSANSGDTLFTGRNIEGYSLKDGRLYFKNLDMTALNESYKKGEGIVVFTLNSERLFTAQSVTPGGGQSVQDLALCHTPDSTYLVDAYPSQLANSDLALQRKEARKAEWQTFTDFLQKMEKLIPVPEEYDPVPNPGEPADTVSIPVPDDTNEPIQTPGEEETQPDDPNVATPDTTSVSR